MLFRSSDADHPTEAKDVQLRDALHGVLADATTPEDAMRGMEELLRSHRSPSGDPLDAACIHGEEYGTVSASTVQLDEGGGITYRHAPGRPCVTPFATVQVV